MYFRSTSIKMYSSSKMKCKFIKVCPYYNKESEICNRDGGGYYDDGDGFQRPAGCWRDLEKAKQEGKR